MILLALILAVVMFGAALMLDSYFAMLLVGAAHSADPHIPALGFLAVLALVAAVRCVTGVSGQVRNSK